MLWKYWKLESKRPSWLNYFIIMLQCMVHMIVSQCCGNALRKNFSPISEYQSNFYSSHHHAYHQQSNYKPEFVAISMNFIYRKQIFIFFSSCMMRKEIEIYTWHDLKTKISELCMTWRDTHFAEGNLPVSLKRFSISATVNQACTYGKRIWPLKNYLLGEFLQWVFIVSPSLYLQSRLQTLSCQRVPTSVWVLTTAIEPPEV